MHGSFLNVTGFLMIKSVLALDYNLFFCFEIRLLEVYVDSAFIWPRIYRIS